MKQKLKQIIVDNLLAMVISFIAFIGGAYALAYKIVPELRILWFFAFFIGFAVFMYNVTVIIKVDHLQRHIIKDIKDLSDGKIDNKQGDKPLE